MQALSQPQLQQPAGAATDYQPYSSTYSHLQSYLASSQAQNYKLEPQNDRLQQQCDEDQQNHYHHNQDGSDFNGYKPRHYDNENSRYQDNQQTYYSEYEQRYSQQQQPDNLDSQNLGPQNYKEDQSQLYNRQNEVDIEGERDQYVFNGHMTNHESQIYDQHQNENLGFPHSPNFNQQYQSETNDKILDQDDKQQDQVTSSQNFNIYSNDCGDSENKLPAFRQEIQNQDLTENQNRSKRPSTYQEESEPVRHQAPTPVTKDQERVPQQKQISENMNFLKKPFNQLNPLEKLKYSQHVFKQNWKGIITDFTGRPGTSTLCNKKRHFTDPSQLIEEDKRQAVLHRIVDIIAKVEQDIPVSQQIQNQVAGDLRQNKSAYNFYQNKKQQQINQYVADQQDISKYLDENSTISSVKNFKTIKMHQLLNDLPPTQTFGNRMTSTNLDNSELLYKILRGDTKLVRSMLEANGMTYTESHEWNILWSSSSCKAYLYEGMNEYQRINHFPSSYEVTRKDRLCFNMVKMQEKFGRQNYDIVPDTYILPNEYKEFVQHFNMLAQKEPKKNIWIVKPANLSRGRGIHLIDSLSDVVVDDTSVISRYITNPLLINGHKFDLRIYVLVTSYDPLRIYVFKEGLARFASETYSSKMDKDNKFAHLTNYSINKKNDNFVYNQNHEQDDVGFKWSLSAFCSHLEQVGIDMNLMWSRIYDLIIKAILSGENYVNAAMKKYNLHRTNCFEVFGYDVILDSELKPWLLEVNLSPSLACESPLDLTIKSTLLADTFNMIGIKKYDRRKESLSKMKHRGNAASTKGSVATSNAALQAATQSQSDIFHPSSTHFVTPQVSQLIERFVQEEALLGELNGSEEILNQACLLKNRDIILETLSEYSRKGNFVRIFPSKHSNMYDQYFQGARPLNRLVHKVLYSDRLLKHQGFSLNQIKISSPKIIQHQDIDLISQSSSTSTTATGKHTVKHLEDQANSQQPRKAVFTQLKNSNPSLASSHQETYSSLNNNTTPRSQANRLRSSNNQVLASSSGLDRRNINDLSSKFNGQTTTYQPVKTSVNNYMTQSMNGTINQSKQDEQNRTKLQNNAVIRQSKSPSSNKSQSRLNTITAHSYQQQQTNQQNLKKAFSPDSSVHSSRQVSQSQPYPGSQGHNQNHQFQKTTNYTKVQLSSSSIAQTGSRSQNKSQQSTPLKQKETNGQISNNQSMSSQSNLQSQKSLAGAHQNSNLPKQTQSQENQEKIVITGDDILIEYVQRIVYVLSKTESIQEKSLQDMSTQQIIQDGIQRFVQHQVWHVKEQNQSQPETPLWVQMELRMNEMLDRRRRLIKYMLKKEGKIPQNAASNSPELEVFYKDIIEKKNSVVQRFSSHQLEDLLKTSTKNVAQEVVSCMIPIQEGMKGLLLELEKMYPIVAKQRKDQVKQARLQKEKGEVENHIDSASEITRKSSTNYPNQNSSLGLGQIQNRAAGSNRAVSPNRVNEASKLASNSHLIKRAQSRQNERYVGGLGQGFQNSSSQNTQRSPLKTSQLNKTFCKNLDIEFIQLEKGRMNDNSQNMLSQSQTINTSTTSAFQAPKSAKNGNYAGQNAFQDNGNQKQNPAFSKAFQHHNPFNQVLSSREMSNGTSQRTRFMK